MKNLFILLISTILFSSEYPSFTNIEISHIQKKSKIAKNRVIDYSKKIKLFTSYSKEKQLRAVNVYLNRLLPQYDDIITNKENNWATPKEFLTVGYGDCEDYVIIKYYTLIKLGFDDKKLFITVVKEKFKGGSHMVLSYFKTQCSSPLILDNLSFKILPLDKRHDLQAEYFINSTGVFKLSKNLNLLKVADRAKEFEELEEKVKNNL
ncbi:hypothetical protein GJV85_04945 [Sulfurimonas aquatica]|uniref:Transglutaminase n=1 Tax=Sulfurimonas aquatica TaxID=2672570 RepID=A0A975GDT8_9BACT|nr:hypothetical protein GJV85_04945 [Sulfurimonas aquatica]